MSLLFRVFSILFLFEVGFSADCPQDWLPVDSHDLCIHIGKDVGDYDHVVQRCVSMGGYPAIITDAFINGMIRDELSKANIDQAYIGVERYNQEWRYADGKNMTYKRWNNGEPRSDEYKGIIDSTNGYWSTVDDFRNLSYVCTQKTTKVNCDPDWKGFGDFCYWTPGFTYSDGKHWDLMDLTTAEQKCREIGVHLASIHSQSELQFIYEVIYTNITENEANKAVTDDNGCTHMWAWSGLYHDGVKNYTTWTDGTPIDYIGESAVYCFNSAGIVLLNDYGDCWDPDEPSDYEYWVASTTLARYVCKKAANGW